MCVYLDMTHVCVLSLGLVVLCGRLVVCVLVAERDCPHTPHKCDTVTNVIKSLLVTRVRRHTLSS